MREHTVTHFNAENLVVLRDDGAIGAIVAIFDEDGVQVEDFADAHSALARFPDGMARFDLGEREKVSLH